MYSDETLTLIINLTLTLSLTLILSQTLTLTFTPFLQIRAIFTYNGLTYVYVGDILKRSIYCMKPY